MQLLHIPLQIGQKILRQEVYFKLSQVGPGRRYVMRLILGRRLVNLSHLAQRTMTL